MKEVSPVKVAQRVEGRCRADLLIELMDLSGLDEDGIAAFFEQWIKKFPERLAKPRPPDKSDEPLTPTEANNFAEFTCMPRGEYIGSAVGDVPAEYLEWWVDQSNTEFTRQLRRYVRSSYFEQHRARDAPGDEYEPEE